MKATKCSYADKYQAKREPTCRCEVCGLKWINAQLQAELNELRSAAEALYVAAHWTPDRPCNASVLWMRLRIALARD